MSKNNILSVENLSISFFNNSEEKEIIHNISYQLQQNEILGIVGESGSGKSVSTMAILGLLPKKISEITSGSILFKGEDLTTLDSKAFQEIRGNKISVIFQEPMSSLNPSMTCGKQVSEVILQHKNISKTEAKAKVISLFEQVKLPIPETTYNKYPHEISGGQMQRVMIAMAIACEPEILIADEPTTALDVTVQKEIIQLLKELQAKNNMSILFITHDLSLISEIAHRVLVMYKGEVVEQGDLQEVFTKPKNNYTKALISSRPSLDYRLKTLPTIQDYLQDTTSKEIITEADREKHHKTIYSKAPLLEIINLEKEYFNTSGLFHKTEGFKAVNNVSFKLYEGETLGLVGESGCGKSTLGKAILQLDKATAGSIIYKGEDITKVLKQKMRELRKEIQIIFQDPYASLNPRLTVGNAILEPMKVHKLFSSDKERKEKVLEILNRVGLGADSYDRYPHEFSGGQRQRIGIARTIALQPKLIICDESVSALDISVQAQVLNLLNELKADFGFTYIFISHDLAVVKYMADQLLVMNAGKIEELADADEIYNNPKKEYTKKLIHAIPKGL
ncbi:ABC transporter ATP-binding protein [Oceanihabitans sediminis]|uniref:ABC transporter ATP-binding protein n=1 Tax=Oceanihabitans sediminis TaxID=1812012 RepID=A0A368P6W1_9FLAO|nr:ABC transporter ATP-binding protein [Oceanihabitans sediminis]MDX1278094.1 ABC transporter ATP-binding protein [Oceanihabitans sediminis]MDX1772923.1 ABC transporter ATP-binding protein [Oceanihabitans sediminis]RBP34608.1 peptide/nickel transport system ATP-binding protein [Oceanihabitans sediminis]RCU58268.1 ABC transporter ATP-binding protein [Oceanihabitans sediminis]